MYFLKTLTLQAAAKPLRGNRAAAYIYSFSFGRFSKGASPSSSLGVKMRSYSVLPKGLTSHAVIHTAAEHLVWLLGWLRFSLGDERPRNFVKTLPPGFAKDFYRANFAIKPEPIDVREKLVTGTRTTYGTRRAIFTIDSNKSFIDFSVVVVKGRPQSSSPL